ncbi:unnamed protein product [Rotaria magnacalcarata]|nr:unnamed protein product [Rotaria magnacalcarata]CAF1670220.1 unnamed protein product [Rotaria magnacalcarata]CAF2065165.1 unnamed protein product [Rotaria magnacalcarata]CAF2117745.1 unnamed protein product [Rotaria magnacalcarata]CAF3739866.1 unnamed protein product [Rotaria magnacalcarata]
MVTITTAETKTQAIEQATHAPNNEQPQTSDVTRHYQTIDDSEQIALSDDDFSTSDSDEEYNYNHHQHPHHNEAIWPQAVHKRYSHMKSRTGNPSVHGDESRAWAIPYRFGKRSAMPYRFGKRSAMPYRFGKRSAMPYRFGKRSAMPYRFGKRAAAMHFRLGKKSASL